MKADPKLFQWLKKGLLKSFLARINPSVSSIVTPWKKY